MLYNCLKQFTDKMKRIIWPLFIIIIIFGLGFFGFRKLTAPKIVHFHAGFKVFVDGKMQDFSDPIYMNVEPCSVHAQAGNNQAEKAHLHDGNGDVVHVHRSNAVWGDLFKNINYKFPASKPIAAYINGKKIDQVFTYPIKPYDSLIILVGNHLSPDGYLGQAVTVSRIKQVEKLSETCGSNP